MEQSKANLFYSDQTAPAEQAEVLESEPKEVEVITEENNVEPVETSSQNDTKPSIKKVKISLENEDYNLDLPEKIADYVKNGVLMEHKFRKDTQVLADERRKFEAEIAESKKRQESLVAELGAQLMFMQNELQSEEMLELKKYSPQEYAQKRIEYDDRYAAYQKYINSQIEQHENEQKRLHEENSKREFENLKQLVPDWIDESVMREDGKKVAMYAKEIGFSQKEIESISQAKLARVFRDAMLFNESKKKVLDSKNKPINKILKSSGNTQKPDKKSVLDLFYGD